MTLGLRKSGVLLCLLFSVSACSTESGVQQTQQQMSSRAQFSDEEKRVARVLSIGSEAQKGDIPPQYEAALCKLALTGIAKQLKESDALSAQQLHALEQATKLYGQRASAGLSPQEREKMRGDVEAAYPDERDRMRVAMRCVRELA